MPLELNALEQRVIGCLLEKQISTPDQYPLSLNALSTPAISAATATPCSISMSALSRAWSTA